MSEKIEITTENALKAYKNAGKEIKAFLEDFIGREIFRPQNIMDRLFTLEDACRETGRDINTLFPEGYDEYDKARKTLEIFAEALREGASEQECLYYPLFDRSGGSFRFVDCAGDYGFTCIGGRLRVNSLDKAFFFGTQLLDVWKIYINGIN